MFQNTRLEKNEYICPKLYTITLDVLLAKKVNISSAITASNINFCCGHYELTKIFLILSFLTRYQIGNSYISIEFS